jgi:hypothetical protein
MLNLPKERGAYGPASSSSLYWRWSDRNAGALSEAELAELLVLSVTHAAEVNREAISAHPQGNRKAALTPQKSLELSGLGEAAVSAWLSALPVESACEVVVSWDEANAIRMSWSLFMKRWAEFCYPASDNATVLPLDQSWALHYEHWQELQWYSRGAA